MEKVQKKHNICRFGINCKYGKSCRFDHPQRNLQSQNQQSFYYGTQYAYQYPVEQLQNHFYLLNLGQTENNYQNNEANNHDNNVQFFNDAQYQQQIYQSQYLQANNLQSNSKGNNKKCKCKPGRKQFKALESVKREINHKNYSDSENSDEEFSPKQDSSQDQEQQHAISNNFRNSDEKNQGLIPILENEKIKKKHKKKFKHQFFKKNFNKQSFQQYEVALKQFFQTRHIKPHKRQGILQFLSKQYPEQTQIVEIILPIIYQLDKQNFVQHFCYKKLFKTICKQNFEMQAIKAKLMKKINIDLKRKQKDDIFLSRFPNPVEVEFLQTKELLNNENENKNSIYLIDGNNCLTTQKHLRYWFQQTNIYSKVQAQIRFRWFVSLVITDPKRCIIFFDDKYDEKIYEAVALEDIKMEYSEYQQMLKNSTVIYADPNKQADEAIRNKLKQLTQSLSEKQLSNILLITADRVLVQECYEIHHLRKSSGMYLVKFCKKIIKQNFTKYHPKNKITKRILTYY